MPSKKTWKINMMTFTWEWLIWYKSKVTENKAGKGDYTILEKGQANICRARRQSTEGRHYNKKYWKGVNIQNAGGTIRCSHFPAIRPHLKLPPFPNGDPPPFKVLLRGWVLKTCPLVSGPHIHKRMDCPQCRACAQGAWERNCPHPSVARCPVLLQREDLALW